MNCSITSDFDNYVVLEGFSNPSPVFFPSLYSLIATFLCFVSVD